MVEHQPYRADHFFFGYFILILKTIGNRKGDCAWSCSRWQTQPEKICKSQHTNQCHSLRTLYWFVLCNLQIFSGCVCHLEQLHAQSSFLLPIVFSIKGEVQAICRFWVFEGNGLLGHRLIDSRWFEKNPPTESGWKRRSKKTPTYRYFARKWSWRNMCFQIRAISSRPWFTYIFAFDSGSLSIAGGWRKCGTLPIFVKL